MISNVSFSGDMAWDKTGHTFYFIDHAECRIERYCYNKRDNELSEQFLLIF